MNTKLAAREIENQLGNFYGTQAYHRWSGLFPSYVLTDGAKFLADAAGAYWLMDAIASWQTNRDVRKEGFQKWTLTAKKATATLICNDGNGHNIVGQKIGYTDFPLDEIVLYFIDGVILLPGEY